MFTTASLLKIALTVLVSLLFVAPAMAASTLTSNPAFLQVGSATSIPIGHAEFCKTHRKECKPNRGATEYTTLTEARWAQLVAVNNDVNSRVVPVTDQDLYQMVEYWTYPQGGYGDCEDIALQKRRDLISKGWNPSTLLMTVVRQANGEGHAVLMVRTDRGDLILDNQEGRVLVWNETPYEFLKRQSQADAGKWVSLTNGRQMVVASK